MSVLERIRDFVNDWEGHAPAKEAFESLFDLLREWQGLNLSFESREGVSHSLRARHEAQKERPLFVLVDVVEDAGGRFLSVCFYEDMIRDPDELGETVPGGLLGEDGYCFDVDEARLVPYITARVREAVRSAAEN